MSSAGVIAELPSTCTIATPESDAKRWYAIQTRTRCEKAIAARLEDKGIESYLPMLRHVHRWSDRRKRVEVAMFPGYVFVHVELTQTTRLMVLQTFGVFSFVVFNGQTPAIPEDQIDCLARIDNLGLSFYELPFIKVGQRVRIRGGCLDGLEGILQRRNGQNALVISVFPIERSIAVPIDTYSIEPI